MHKTQEKLLELAEKENLAAYSLRKLAEMIGESVKNPQKIKHHLQQLFDKGLIMQSLDGKKIEKVCAGANKKSILVSLPIYGSANCGQALSFADNRIEGYLQVSKGIMGEQKLKRLKDFFVLKASGNSMNKAGINDGDYLIIDRDISDIKNGDIVLSIIGEVANIKKFHKDPKNKRITLFSESYGDYPPICIDDVENYALNGKVVDTIINPNSDDEWLKAIQDTACQDISKRLDPLSKEEIDYYMNLPEIKR